MYSDIGYEGTLKDEVTDRTGWGEIVVAALGSRICAGIEFVSRRSLKYS